MEGTGDFFRLLTATAMPVAMMAALAMVVVMIRYTRAIRGSSKKPDRRIKGRNLGSSSRLRPCRPSFLASRWTIRKMPVKYRQAGRMARRAM